MFGCVKMLYGVSAELAALRAGTDYRSPLDGSAPLPSKLNIAVPSIMLAAELPKNLPLGFKVPSTRILCPGTM